MVLSDYHSFKNIHDSINNLTMWIFNNFVFTLVLKLFLHPSITQITPSKKLNNKREHSTHFEAALICVYNHFVFKFE